MRAADPDNNTRSGASPSAGSNPTSTEGLRQQIFDIFDKNTELNDPIYTFHTDKMITEMIELFDRYASTKAKAELEKLIQRLPDPNNNVEEWRGHNLGLSQAIYVIDEAIAALDGENQA